LHTGAGAKNCLFSENIKKSMAFSGIQEAYENFINPIILNLLTP
jgi:hypothetical protein